MALVTLVRQNRPDVAVIVNAPRFVRDVTGTVVLHQDDPVGNLEIVAASADDEKHADKQHTLEPVLRASDRDELLHWLRRRPLMHYCKRLGYALIHAGLPPQWSLKQALARAHELEQALQGDGFHDYCMAMYGNRPARWSRELRGMERLRFITNCFTRLRYCEPDGTLVLKEKGAPGSQRAHALPWFTLPDRATRDTPILFGHWSTLGYHHADNCWALDSGCLWGGRLTALRLRRQKPPILYQVDCQGARRPG